MGLARTIAGRTVMGLAAVELLAHCDAFGSSDPATAPVDASVGPIRDANDPARVDSGPLGDAAGCGHCRSRHCQPGGGCDPLVFITEARVRGDLDSAGNGRTGAARADEICAQEAGSPGTFRAWLSDEADSALARQTGVKNRPLWLSDDVLAAPSLDALVSSGRLSHAIDRTVARRVVEPSERVWTGTNPDGSTATLHCKNWQPELPTNLGEYGALDTSSRWASARTTIELPCSSTSLRLYCFEVVAD